MKEQVTEKNLGPFFKDRVNLQYQYRRRTDTGRATFTNDLDQMAGTTKVDLYIG